MTGKDRACPYRILGGMVKRGIPPSLAWDEAKKMYYKLKANEKDDKR